MKKYEFTGDTRTIKISGKTKVLRRIQLVVDLDFNKLPRRKHSNAARAFASCYAGAGYSPQPRYARY